MSDTDLDEFNRLFDMDDADTGVESEPENPVLDPEPDPVDPEPDPVDPEPDPVDPEPDPESGIDYKAELAKERQRFKSFEGRYKKEKAEWEAAASHPPPEPKPESEPDPEEAFLTKFRQEYNDDVIKAVELIAERKLQARLGEFKQANLDPLLEHHVRSAHEAHFNTIKSAHNDWEAVVESPAFGQWVEQQPAFLRNAYSQVLERGSAHDVVDLLSAYKNAHKPVAPAIDRSKVRQASTVKPTRGAVSAQPSGHGTPKSFDELWDEVDD